MIWLCCKTKEEDFISNTAEQQSSTRRSDNSAESVYYDAVANLDDRQSMVASSIFYSAVGAPAAATHGNRSRRSSSATHGNRRSSSVTLSLLFLSTRLRQRFQENYPFPGHLTDEQLQICLDFRKRISDVIQEEDGVDNATRREIVYAFNKIENEAYSICRYLRARDFDIDATLQMIDGYMPRWKEGREHNFYPDFYAVSNHRGDESALLSQYPLVIGGLAKNGCLILYFTVKQLSLDGIECVMNLDRIGPYMWFLVLQKYVNEVQKRKKDDQAVNIRPVQVTVVVDLDGLQILTLRRALPALQTAFGILSVFPEFLFNVVICNVPRFFNAFWRIIKTFLDPATANKFELYSNRSAGQARLLEIIHPSELAKNFGGNGLSTDELVQPVEGCSRQIVNLVKVIPGGRGECTVSKSENENVAINIYTSCTCDATFSIDSSTQQYKLQRKDNEPKDGPYFRDKVASLGGKGGHYRATIEMAKGDSSSHHGYFLIVALVTEN